MQPFGGGVWPNGPESGRRRGNAVCTSVSQNDPIREITRLMNEISRLNAQILEHVYRKAWDRDRLQALHDEVEERKGRLAGLRARAAESVASRRQQITKPDDGDAALNLKDTRLIANALYTQRPLIYQSEEWPAYRRVCAALVRVFAYELQDRGEFDSIEFLTHCGLSLKEAEAIARSPGDYIRRSEEFLGGS